MMIHNRFKNPEAWTAYKTHVALGRIFHVIGRNFQRFMWESIRREGEGVPFKQGPVRVHTLLNELG
jgi:hypothetical protein